MPVKSKSQRFSWALVLSLAIFLVAIISTVGVFQVVKKMIFAQAQYNFEKSADNLVVGIRSHIKTNSNLFLSQTTSTVVLPLAIKKVSLTIANLDELVSDLSVYNEKFDDIKLYFDNGKSYSPPQVILTLDNVFKFKKIISGYIRTVKTLNIDGNSWSVGLVAPVDSFLFGNENFALLGILVIGILISLLLFLAVFTLLSTRNSALQLADSMTQRLASSEDKYRSLVEGIPDVVWTIDKDKKPCFVSHNIEELTGYTHAEMVADSELWLNIINEEDVTMVRRAMHSFFTTGKILDIQYRIKHRQGQTVWVHNQSLSFHTKNGNKFADGILSNITKEKSIDVAKSEFVSLASHQLRTPLSTINWYAELLLGGDIGKLTVGQKKIVKEIFQSNQRLVKLVDALLNISRIEMGSYAIIPEKISLQTVLKEVLRDLSEKIQEKHIDISIQFSKKIPTLFLDINLIRIILQNLISNAVKYSQEKGSVDVKIEFIQKADTISETAPKISDSILIRVTDSGCGIPEDQKTLIFSKLFRASNVQEKGFDGNGLGLYIVKSIIEQTGGKIWFESKENIGSVFFISLPTKPIKARQGNKRLV